MYENKPADNIQERTDNDYLSRVCIFVSVSFLLLLTIRRAPAALLEEGGNFLQMHSYSLSLVGDWCSLCSSDLFIFLQESPLFIPWTLMPCYVALSHSSSVLLCS